MSKLKGRKPATVSPGKIKMLTFSKAGVGKTWLSMDFPSVFYIDTEGGARLAHYQQKLETAGGAYFGPEDGAMDCLSVLGQIEALATEKHSYKTVAIGSITKLYQSIIASEQIRLGDKDQFGASKKPAVSFMRRLTLWLHRLDLNVLLESHEATEWGVNPKTGNREEIGSVPDVWDKLVYELDLTLRLEKRGPARVCVVRKSRLTGFPEGESFPCEYAAFAERYGKDFMESPAAPIQLATPEQVAEITRLRGIVTIDDAKFEAVLSRAGAAEIADLSYDQAESTIKWIKEKIA